VPAPDRWNISGITTFSAGIWSGATFSYTTNVNQTGSVLEGVGAFGGGTGARTVLAGNPMGNSGSAGKDILDYDAFNVDAFAAPVPCSATRQTLDCFGNAAPTFMRGPGYSNWDMTFSKQIPVGLGERRALLLRAEFYNIFNHAEFNAMNTAAQFNLATGARVTTGTGGNFGTLTGTRTPRQVALTLRFEF